jgi:membrane carboxypeptidase/penicillin-binding protein
VGGLDKPQTIVEGGYGGTLSLPIWADVMKKAVALGYKTEVPKVRPAAHQGDALPREQPARHRRLRPRRHRV